MRRGLPEGEAEAGGGTTHSTEGGTLASSFAPLGGLGAFLG
jgi:hypothetical protein